MPSEAAKAPLSPGYAERVALFFAAVFLVAGTQMPYLPVWLDLKGLTAGEIAIVTAAPLVVRIVVTPAIAFLADRHGDHRRVLVVLAWIGFAALALLPQAAGFWFILLLTMVFALAWTSIMPLTETIAMAGVRAGGLDYGRMRLWGSISFIAASLAGGAIVARQGPWITIWLIVGSGALVALAAHALPPAAKANGPARARPSLAEAARLILAPRFALFLLAVGTIQAAHAVFYTFGTLHWMASGLSTTWCGILWTIGVVAEIALFARSAPVVARIGALGLIGVAGGAAVFRWLLMGLDPPLALLIPLQILHGATYGAAHLGAVHFMAKAVPEAQAGTAQALYASITAGIAMGGATLVAGQLYGAVAGKAYFAMAALALAGLIATVVLMRHAEPATRPG